MYTAFASPETLDHSNSHSLAFDLVGAANPRPGASEVGRQVDDVVVAVGFQSAVVLAEVPLTLVVAVQGQEDNG